MKRHLIFFAATAGVLLTLLITTDPNKVPSLMLILPFVLLFLLLFSAFLLLFKGRNWSRPKKVRSALLLSGIPITLLILQSVGQLTVRDIVTIAAISVVAYFYLSRMAIAK